MAIIRHEINKDFAAMKTALATLIPSIFSAVEYDDDENPTAIKCYDANDNVIFEISSSWYYKAYKSDGTYISSGSVNDYSKAAYLYTIGNAAAVIHCAYAKAAPGAFVVLSRTNTGTVGVAVPRVFGATSANADIVHMYVASWDDDPAFTSYLTITDPATPMDGNQTQFVSLPLHGTFNEKINMHNVFYLPMAQSNLRGVAQELTDATSGEHYLTNGYIAVKDE